MAFGVFVDLDCLIPVYVFKFCSYFINMSCFYTNFYFTFSVVNWNIVASHTVTHTAYSGQSWRYCTEYMWRYRPTPAYTRGRHASTPPGMPGKHPRQYLVSRGRNVLCPLQSLSK